MIVREIKDHPELINTFDWFNDYNDTRYWARHSCPELLKRLDGGFKQWLRHGMLKPKKSPVDKTIEDIANEIRRDRNEALERITTQEFVRLIKEMIDSGDFEQLIQMGKMPGEITGSGLTYVPFRKKEELKAEIAELKDQQRDFPRVCHWKEVDGYWVSSCGLEWQLPNDDTPKENGMNYCPKCGAVLIEAEVD